MTRHKPAPASKGPAVLDCDGPGCRGSSGRWLLSRVVKYITCPMAPGLPYGWRAALFYGRLVVVALGVLGVVLLGGRRVYQ